MTDVYGTQGKVLVAYDGDPDYVVSQGKTLVLYNLPAKEIRSTQGFGKALYSAQIGVNVTQAKMMALYSGRVTSPKLKTMGFNLDAHTFYCIRLGSDRKTLVYDKYTETWSWWCRGSYVSLDSHTGINWRSAGSIANNYGSNILLGDASNGNLYILDPYSPMDSDSTDEFPFSRVATGQITNRGRKSEPVYNVYLTASLGRPAYEGASISLSYSDNQGNSYIKATPKEIIQDKFDQQIFWRSLGQIPPPGRLFRIEDDGAVQRIDSLDVNIT